MSRDARKKQRHRQKRASRQRDLRRVQTASPYRRIGSAGGEVACYINRNWRGAGTATIQCLRRVPGGGHAVAAFLVDLWCMGLKEARGALDVTAEAFHERMRNAPPEVDLIRVDADVVKRIVAGGIRFAKQNGFRLPRRYERWVTLLGDLGDIDSAELTDFGADGGLRYVGSVSDLEKRLVNESAEAFLARGDVHYICEVPGSGLLDDDAPALDEVLDGVKERGLTVVRRWCFANGMQPHSRLPEAWDLLFEALMQAEPDLDATSNTDADCSVAANNIERFLDLEAPREADELTEALAQVQAFVQQYGSPEELADAVTGGLSEDAP